MSLFCIFSTCPSFAFSIRLGRPLLGRYHKQIRMPDYATSRLQEILQFDKPRDSEDIVPSQAAIRTSSRTHTRKESRYNASALYCRIMEEESIITAVQPGPRTTIDGSLDLEFLHVRFRKLGRSNYQGKVCKASLKSPSWLSDLQPWAPSDGYIVENGEFTASISKDSRIMKGLEVTVELTYS